MDTQQLEARQARLLELEAQISREMTAARYELQQAADELRQAQAELRRRQINIRTEKQVAAELGCSVATVRRVRKDHRIPYTAVGNLIRYTDEQFLKLLEAMERPRQAKKTR